MDKILEASLAYRLYSRAVNSVAESASNSVTWSLIAFITVRFRYFIRFSAVAGFFTRVADGFGRQIRGSVLVERFMLIREPHTHSENSVFSRAFYWFLGISRALTHSLKLRNILEGSIFAKPLLWCSLAVALAPLAPTKVIIGLVALSYVSLFIDMTIDMKRRLKSFSINKYVWIYALIYVLATVASVSFSASIYVGAVTVLFVLFFIVLTNSIHTRVQLRGLVTAMVWIGVIVAAYGFVQFIFPEHFVGGWIDESMFEYRFRVYSRLENPNVLGEYFLLIIPFAFACLLTAKTKQGRLFYIVAAFAMLACLVLTYSRGAYLGIIVSIAVFFVLLDRRFILPGILLAAVVVFALPTTFIERLMSIGNRSDSSTSYRVFIWLGTLSMLRHYWFSGIGPGEAAFGRVYRSTPIMVS